MKKEHAYRFLYALSVMLLFAFAVRVGADWLKYDDANNSAPFILFAAVRAAEFVLPSLSALIAGIVLKSKYAG